MIHNFVVFCPFSVNGIVKIFLQIFPTAKTKMLSEEVNMLLILAVVELLLNIEVVISNYSYKIVQKPINLVILNILVTLILQALFTVRSIELIEQIW